MTKSNPIHHALCPDCGHPAVSERPIKTGGLSESHFVCLFGHGWQTKWTAAAA